MDEKKRTKILAATLAGVLCFMFLRPDQRLMKPINDARTDLQTAEASLEKAEANNDQLLYARERIQRGREASLPPQTADAQRVYQRWVTNLADQCRFTPLSVAPGNTDLRRGKFLTVDVIVEAETDLDGLSRFLYLFERAELMHRVSSLEIESSSTSGNPRMEIKLTAQGLSVLDSADHNDVFPLTSLAEDFTDDATELNIADPNGFPKEAPFVAQVGREMVQVTAVNGTTWTVERGLEETTAVAHKADEYVQLFPIAFERRETRFDDYAGFVNSSPFTKPEQPRTRSPRLISISDKTIAPGDVVKMTAKAEDLDADIGVAVFTLENGVEGMSIDAATGEFQWAPSADLEPESYDATVVLTQKNNDELRLEKKISITIKLPNEAPKISVPEKAIVVLGRDFNLPVSAEDDGPKEALKYSLDGEVPEGLSVDTASATLKWTPAKTFTPGEYTVTVKVADGGDPAKSDSGKIILSVRDDSAILTRFTGSVSLDGEPLAFFRDLSANRNPQLKVGDRITAAEIDAEVTEVARRHVLLADADGVWRLKLGENLRQRELIEPAAKDKAKSTEQPAADGKESSAGETSVETPEKPEASDEDKPPAEKVEKPDSPDVAESKAAVEAEGTAEGATEPAKAAADDAAAGK